MPSLLEHLAKFSPRTSDVTMALLGNTEEQTGLRVDLHGMIAYETPSRSAAILKALVPDDTAGFMNIQGFDRARALYTAGIGKRSATVFLERPLFSTPPSLRQQFPDITCEAAGALRAIAQLNPDTLPHIRQHGLVFIDETSDRETAHAGIAIPMGKILFTGARPDYPLDWNNLFGLKDAANGTLFVLDGQNLADKKTQKIMRPIISRMRPVGFKVTGI